MDRYTPENRLLITYEGLTDDLIGAEVTKGLNEFLGMANGVTPIDRDSVGCIWRAVVKNQPPEEQKAQFERLQSQAVNSAGTASGAQPAVVHDVAVAAQPAQPAVPVQAQPGIPNRALDAPTPDGTDHIAELEREGQAQLAHAQELMQNWQTAAAGTLTAEQQQAEEQKFLQLQAELMGGSQPVEQQSPSGLRRRLDPGHHNSQRKGPEVPRPYTTQQLDNMMNMLVEVAERYQQQDVRLYHIMMGYYEKIREERMKLSPDDGVLQAPPGGFF